MKAPDVLYHYTTGNVFKRILFQGAIEPDRTEPENEKEIPTVTFSSHPEWERTRFRVGRLPDGRLIMMNQSLLKQFDGGLIRIVVPGSIAPIDWKEMKANYGMSREAIKGIYDFSVSAHARLIGSPQLNVCLKSNGSTSKKWMPKETGSNFRLTKFLNLKTSRRHS
jgi:hypothetical protein